MNYRQTIDYLFTKLPMFSRIGAAAIKKDLTNTIVLCKSLGDPQKQFKTVHIAGTNGKGSVSHMLAAILQTAGYKTGLYTSPHLHDFRERIKVNGEMVNEDFVVDFTERIKTQIETIEPSFFEITVAMAFKYFAEQKVDIAVIETGLGGRLDSTNIITPELSIITNIGWDHMNLLGNSLAEIAYEKAGIIKPTIPVVIGEVTEESKPVFEKRVKEEASELIHPGSSLQLAAYCLKDECLVVEVKDLVTETITAYLLDLPGFYQAKNLLTVLASVKELQKQGWKITEEHIHSALSKTKRINGLHGRWEKIQQNPTVVLDVGHNEDGVRQIIHQLKHTSFNHLHIIIGMVKDKEIDKVLSLLPVKATYYFTKAQIPRALDEKQLQEKAKVFDLTGETYSDVNTALNKAKQAAAKDDLILVCGSVFLVGEVTL